jgi:preprotein translocase subunit SecE
MATQAVKVNEEKPSSQLAQRVTGSLQGTREFLQETRVEMKKVTWPTRNDVVSTTGVVIATVFFFGVFLWLVDLGVQHGVQYVFKMFGL